MSNHHNYEVYILNISPGQKPKNFYGRTEKVEATSITSAIRQHIKKIPSTCRVGNWTRMKIEVQKL